MAKLITDTEIVKMTRKQLKALLAETTDVAGAKSVGSAMEYTLVMLDGSRVSVLVNDGAETEHELIIDRNTEISRAKMAGTESACETCGGTGEIEVDVPETVRCPECTDPDGYTATVPTAICPECLDTGMELDHNGRTCGCETGQRLAFVREEFTALMDRLDVAYGRDTRHLAAEAQR
jgi:hypothetical protein